MEHQRSQRGKEWQNTVEGCESEARFMKGRVKFDIPQHLQPTTVPIPSSFDSAVSAIEDKIRNLEEGQSFSFSVVAKIKW
jgi:hypothetical protein